MKCSQHHPSSRWSLSVLPTARWLQGTIRLKLDPFGRTPRRCPSVRGTECLCFSGLWSQPRSQPRCCPQPPCGWLRPLPLSAPGQPVEGTQVSPALGLAHTEAAPQGSHLRLPNSKTCSGIGPCLSDERHLSPPLPPAQCTRQLEFCFTSQRGHAPPDLWAFAHAVPSIRNTLPLTSLQHS